MFDVTVQIVIVSGASGNPGDAVTRITSRWTAPEVLAQIAFFPASEAAAPTHGAPNPVYGLS